MTTTIVLIIARILGTKRRDMATGRGLELCHDVYFVPLCNITPFPMAKKSELLLSSKTSGSKNWRKLFSFVKILLALRGGKDFRGSVRRTPANVRGRRLSHHARLCGYGLYRMARSHNYCKETGEFYYHTVKLPLPIGIRLIDL